MKRFTLLMLMLLVAVTTFAQLEVGKVYQLKSGRDASKVMYNKTDKPGTAAMSNSDYSQYFVVEEGTVEGTYALCDLNYNKYLKPNKARSGKWTNSDDKTADTDLYISVENNETGAVSIRFSEPSVAGTHNGAHHESWYGDIVSWEATSDASRWTPVEIGTIESLNTEIENLKTVYNDAKTEATTILASANYSLVSTTEIALQVKDPNAAGYVWANTYAPGDEGVIDYLIDGDNGTFFHTNWNSYATDGTKDYLEVDLGEGNSVTNLVFDYVTRHNGNTDFPASVTILGSNDKSEYEEVGTISFGLPVGNTKSYTSPAFGNGKSYRYIRFRVNSTSRGNASVPYFHLAEFNLYKAEVQITEGYEKYVSEVAVVDAANKLAEPTTTNEFAYTGSVLQNSVTAYNDVNREVVLVYNLYYGERFVETQNVVGLRGDAFPKAVLNPNWTYVKATTPEGLVETAGSHDITLTVEGCPFVFADSYENINNWYYMTIHNNRNYLYHVENQTYIDASKTIVDIFNREQYAWGFVGDPFNGYKIVNKAAGETMILSSTTNTADGNEGGNTHPIMVAETGIDENTANKLWIPTKSNQEETGFYLAQKGYGSNRMNKRDNKLAYWTAGADGGSTFMVKACDLTGITELQAVIEEAKPFENIEAGTTVGYVTEQSCNYFKSMLESAEAALGEGNSAADRAAAQTFLKSALDNLKTIQPDPNAFYIIKNNCTDHRKDQLMYVNANGGMQFAIVSHNISNGSAGHVFKFEVAEDNKFYLYSLQRGTYLSTAKGHGYGQDWAQATEATAAKAVTISNMGASNIVKIVPVGGAMLHAQNDYSQVVGWNAQETTSASSWIIEEVEPENIAHIATVGSAGYTTLYLNHAAIVPLIEGDDNGVFVAKSTNNGSVQLAKVEAGAVLPAGTGVIVKAGEGSYNFVYSSKTAENFDKGLLLGTCINKYIEGDAYVLGIVDSEVGFYKAKLNKTATGGTPAEGVPGTHFLNNANKVYLPVTEGVSNAPAFYGFDFGGETTAIEEVKTENGEVKTIYDLTGRRVEKITEAGIYIVNGKKVLVK